MSEENIMRFENSSKTVDEIERELYMRGDTLDLGEMFATIIDLTQSNAELSEMQDTMFSPSDVGYAFDDVAGSVDNAIVNFSVDFGDRIDHYSTIIDGENFNEVLEDLKKKFDEAVKELCKTVDREVCYARL